MEGKLLKFRYITIYLLLTLLLFGVIIFIIAYKSKPLEKCVGTVSISTPRVILDAGHGGIDSGAVSLNGTEEAGINLLIAQKTDALMSFLGIYSVMTRSDEGSLNFDPTKSVRENKNADLNERLKLSRLYSNCDYLSIHLNKFDQSKYFGAQVFYSSNNSMSLALAESLQNSFISYLDGSNTRKAKKSPENVYLMNKIMSPAVTIECGFLSNPKEEEKLSQDEYQTHISISITKGYIDYIKE